MKEAITRTRLLMRAAKSLRIRRARQACPTCGATWPLLETRVITSELACQWGLDEHARALFDAREGSLCIRCRSSARSRQLAGALVELGHTEWGTQSAYLQELVREDRFTSLDVAEINSCGALHRVLDHLPLLSYSEYGSATLDIPSEDLMKLSYLESSFDLVITSDTLEHVPDPAIALREIARVLRPGGWHVFSVPIVPDGRPTRQRAMVEDGRLVNKLPPSFHGRPGQAEPDLLVFHEFGLDFIDSCAAAGFRTIVRTDPSNPTLRTLLSHKPGRV